jgi:hypothetical protein
MDQNVTLTAGVFGIAVSTVLNVALGAIAVILVFVIANTLAKRHLKRSDDVDALASSNAAQKKMEKELERERAKLEAKEKAIRALKD